jgi:Glycoside hydrolase 123, catalytic domain/Glycoside hydrolase 123 N-terminal domain
MNFKGAVAGLILFAGILFANSSGGEFTISGMQVWHPGYWGTTSLGDFYGPNYKRKNMSPIMLTGCRNASFSGYIVVTDSISPLEEFKATATDLVSGAGDKILAAQVRIRYADRAAPKHSWAAPYRFDRLLDAPPEEVEMVDLKSHRKWHPKTPGPVAMQPVWVTVKVPAGAKPGAYAGKLIIKALDQKTQEVPIKIQVADFVLADPVDFRIQNVALQSQDAVAKHYGTPMWSEKHLKNMGRSLKLLAQINSKQLAMNLCVNFYGLDGNDQSMVYWIKQKDGSYKYDFSPFDKYLDLAAKTIGKPNLIRLNCWGELNQKTNVMIECGKYVSVLDQKTGELSRMEQPRLGTDASYKLWKPVLETALKKIKDRGWLDVTAFGHNSYCWVVRPEIVDRAHRIWPKGIWAWTAHSGVMGGHFKGSKPEIKMPVHWPDHIWAPGPGARDKDHRGYRTLLKPRKSWLFHTMRGKFRANSPLWVLRTLVERNVNVGHDGVSDFGGDFFPVRNPKRRNRFYCLGNGRGTGGPNCSTRALIAPGPDGPVATERFEGFREGLQICETVLFIQKGINAGQLPEKLLKRANDLLNDRGRRIKKADKRAGLDITIVSEDACKRETELFAVAAEVAKLFKPTPGKK